MKWLVRKIKSSPVVYRTYVTLKHGYQRATGLRHPIQDTGTVSGYKLTRLGSPNCGWTFVDEPSLKNCIILSAGLGEDGSFDVEFASKYGATVHIVDPTPRAISHFQSIVERLGQPKEATYSNTGTQQPKCYELGDVTVEQLQLHKVALWSERKKVKFFLPKNTDHVSHSIVNFQNEYASNTPFIEVDAMPVRDILEKNGVALKDVAMLKLDIEGAEIEVIESIFVAGFLPRQILVEFDEFNVPTKGGVARINRAHSLLVEKGYGIIYTDGQADFLYVRDQANV
ncbi:FkbM family methyltransferase [Paracoccaceae bacterium Fryx2]|nr:FkbM family methyltransferase [Paracoccaceae bacterium Fryx2]